MDLFSHLETVYYCNFDNQDILYFFARGVRVLTKMHFHVRKTFWIFFIIHATIIRLFHFFFHDVQIVEMHSKGNNQIYARI